MALNGILTDDGKEVLAEQGLYDNLKEFRLEDDNGEIYYSDSLANVYFDDKGILTTTVTIANETDLRNVNKYIRLYDGSEDDSKELAYVETDPISFSYGVGAEITIKFPISNEPAQIVYENGDWVANDIFEDTKVDIYNNIDRIDTKNDEQDNRLNNVEWKSLWITDNLTAINRNRLIVDTSEKSITVTLPENPADWNEIIVADGKGNASVNNIIIDGNGKTINGETTIEIDINYKKVELLFIDGEWKVFS